MTLRTSAGRSARLLHWMASPAGWMWAKRLGGLAIVLGFFAFVVLDNFVLVELRIASLGITTRLGWIIAATAGVSYAAGRARRLSR